MEHWSEQAYYWIDDNAVRASRWLDHNIGRIMVVTVSAGLSVYGFQQAEGTFLKSISPELIGIVITAVIIDFVNERRHKIERKESLITQFSSESRDMVRMAHVELWNQGWLFDGSLAGAFLEEANMRGLNLGKAVLRGASLYKANLSRTNLKRANLAGTRLGEANLSGANMQEVDLSESYLILANLSNAYMRGANLRGAHLSAANLSSTNLARANLQDAILIDVDANKVDLPWANLTGAKLLQARLSEADLWGANLSGADMESAELNNAWLRSAILNGAYLHRADLRMANLTGAYFWTIEQLKWANLEGAIMPDEIQLGKRGMGEESISGPSFKEWAAQYITKHGGNEADLRDTIIREVDLVEMGWVASQPRSDHPRRQVDFQ